MPVAWLFFNVLRGSGLLPSLARFYLLYFLSIYLEVVEHFNSRERRGFIVSIKRIFVLLLLFVIIPTLILWNHIGFALDDILYAQWQSMDVDSPVFIIGNARSGTTWLHHLLASNSTNFTTFRTWEIIFAPAVVWKILFISLYNVDNTFCYGLIFAAIMKLENYLLGHITVHKISLLAPEEDEWLMTHITLCQLVTFFFPLCVNIIMPIIMFDYKDDTTTTSRSLDATTKDVIFKYYHSCVQKHLYTFNVLYARGSTNKIFLSKNPPFTLRIETIKKHFNNCKIICIVRDPVESIPSMISYIGMGWRAFATPSAQNKYPNARDLLYFCIAHYMYPLQQESNWPAYQYAFVSYHHLKKSLKATMAALLQKLELYQLILNTNGAEFTKTLHVEELIARVYVSNHHHSVELTCNMKEEELKKSLDVVYTKFRSYFDECGSCRVTSEVPSEQREVDNSPDDSRIKKKRSHKHRLN